MVTLIKNISRFLFPLVLALLLFWFPFYRANSATCTSISRTNVSANSVLTSTRYNADHNTSFAAINSADGGCIQAGTLEADSLSTTDFAVLLNALQLGCKVSYSDANTLSVGKCMLSVNGAFVKTTGANTVTWACSGCSAEAASTKFYLYAKTGSTGTTLNLLISTTAPNEDGYDNSSNRILASFYNTAASAIEQDSITPWNDSGFESCVVGPWRSHTPTIVGVGTESGSVTTYRRFCNSLEMKGYFTAGTTTGVTMTLRMPPGLVHQNALAVVGNTWVGEWEKFNVSESYYKTNESGRTIPGGTTTDIEFSGNVDGSYNGIGELGNAVLSSGNRLIYTVFIPVTAWQ